MKVRVSRPGRVSFPPSWRQATAAGSSHTTTTRAPALLPAARPTNTKHPRAGCTGVEFVFPYPVVSDPTLASSLLPGLGASGRHGETSGLDAMVPSAYFLRVLNPGRS